MSKTSVKDRRVHLRTVTNFDMHGTPEQGGVVARMVARNLSLGGLYCTSTTDFPEMTRLAVRLMLPQNGSTNGESAPLDVEAVVVRREELRTAEPMRYEFALYFTKIEETAREQIERYLEQQAV